MSIPGSASPLFLASTAAAGGYDIPRSLRFNSADSAYLSRTPSSAGNKKTFTWSGWLKSSQGASAMFFFGTSTQFLISLTAANKLDVYNYTSGSSYDLRLETNRVFRDQSAWFHLVVSIDTTQATASDRAKIYVNGTLETSFSTATYPSQNFDCAVNTTVQHAIGNFGTNTSSYFDGYMADIHFIDGQALAATDFGELDSNSVWQPKKFGGTYGTNGFKLDFSDTSSDSALGTDSSGAGNNFSVNNLSATGVGVSTSGWAIRKGSPGGNYNNGTAATLSSGTSWSTSSNNNTLQIDTNALGTYTITFARSSGDNIDFFSSSSASSFGSRVTNSASTITISSTPGSRTHSYNRYVYFGGSGGGNVTFSVSGTALGVDSAAIDVLRDTPVNGDSANDTGAGGEITGNYATWNPLQQKGVLVISNGNLDVTSTNHGHCGASFAVTSGKWYWELTKSSSTAPVADGFGFAQSKIIPNPSQNYLDFGAGRNYIFAQSNGVYMVDAANNVFVSGTSAANDAGVYMFAYDFDARKGWVGKNGTWWSWNSLSGGNPANGANPVFDDFTAGELYTPVMQHYTANNPYFANFGQRAFAYTAPSGYKCLNTANLSDPLIADGSTAFDTKLWTGNGGTQAITGYNFSPDLVWTKQRNHTSFHALFDQIRGVHNAIRSNTTGGTYTDNGLLTAFNSDGFSLGSAGDINGSSSSYVGWAWDAGENSNKTYAVTVSNPGSGNKFYVDGALQPTLTLAEGSTYKFDQSSGTNSTHPLRFSTTSDGTHGGGSEYTTGVTTSGTPGSAGAYTQIVIAASAPTLYAYCTAHSGMGFQINTSDTAGYTIPVGGENSALYDQSQTWSNALTCNVGFHSAYPVTKAFDGTFQGNGGAASATDVSPTFTFTPPASITVTSLEFNCYTSCTLTLPDGSTQTIAGVTTNNTDVAASIGSGFTFTGSNSITLSRTSGHLYLERIKINGKELVDSGVSLTSVPSISSRIQADPSKGFSIVKYSGTGVGADVQTIGHGLSAPPKFVICKNIDAAGSWHVGHEGAGWTTGAYLQLADGFSSSANTRWWNSTAPDSSVVTLGQYPLAGAGEDHIAYCFAPVEGYSAMGSYVGNGVADGSFVYTGMSPALVLIKNTSASGTFWTIFDNKRGSGELYPNEANSESYYPGNTTVPRVLLTSNGFKMNAAQNTFNGSGNVMIYAAFAEHPFKTARAS